MQDILELSEPLDRKYVMQTLNLLLEVSIVQMLHTEKEMDFISHAKWEAIYYKLRNCGFEIKQIDKA